MPPRHRVVEESLGFIEKGRAGSNKPIEHYNFFPENKNHQIINVKIVGCSWSAMSFAIFKGSPALRFIPMEKIRIPVPIRAINLRLCHRKPA